MLFWAIYFKFGKEITPCLAILSQKSENDTANIIKKHIILREKLKIKRKKTQMALRNYIQTSQRIGKKKDNWACRCSIPKSRYHSLYIRKLFQF